MSVAELMEVVPPPARPRDSGDSPAWNGAEAKIGTPLPSDFRDFEFRYGTGVFNDPGRLCIFTRNPLAPDFESQFRSDCNWLREMKECAELDEFPYEVFPRLPGLILWGDDDNGCMFFWLTEGHPDKWPVQVTPPHGYFWERFELPMTSFLAQAFSRRQTCVPWNQPEFFSGPRPLKFAQHQSEIESPAWTLSCGGAPWPSVYSWHWVGLTDLDERRFSPSSPSRRGAGSAGFSKSTSRATARLSA
jgi:hypothetical protein